MEKLLGTALLSGGTVLHANLTNDGLRWTLEGYSRSYADQARQLEWQANFLSDPLFLSYSPAMGMPGYAQAVEVCKKLGGRWQKEEWDGKVPDEVEPEDEEQTTTTNDQEILENTQETVETNEAEEEEEDNTSLSVRAALIAEILYAFIDPERIDALLDLWGVSEIFPTTENAFCPTGPGGGINPTCSPKGVPKAVEVAANPASRVKKNSENEQQFRSYIETLKGRKATAEETAKLESFLSKMTTGELVKLRKEFGVQGSAYKEIAVKNITKGLLEKLSKESGQPQPGPQPTPQPTPQPQPVQRTLPHPELDPNRAPVTIGGNQYSTPRTQRDLDAIITNFSRSSPQERDQILTHYGINPDTVMSFSSNFKQELAKRIDANLNPTSIGESLKNSPHAEFTRKLGELNTKARSMSELGQASRDLVAKEVPLITKEIQLQKDLRAATSGKDRAALRKELRSVQNELTEIGKQRVTITNEMLGNNTNTTTQAHKLIQEEVQKYGTTHQIDAQKFPANPYASKQDQKDVETARAWLDGKIVKKPGDKDIEEVVTGTPASNERSHYNPYDVQKKINLDPYVGPQVAVHEYGHHVDEVVPGVIKSSLAFLEHRVGNEQPIKMKDLYPRSNYKENEYGRKDEFDKSMNEHSAYYVGKDYKGRFTEVVSMGMQKMYEDPVNFAKKDPEYFNFVLGVMSGEHRRKTLPP